MSGDKEKRLERVEQQDEAGDGYTIPEDLAERIGQVVPHSVIAEGTSYGPRRMSRHVKHLWRIKIS